MEPRKIQASVDLLRSLDGDGWADIALANRLLSGLEPVEPPMDAEAEAFQLAAQALDADQHEGERVRLAGYSRTEAGDFSLGVTEGVFDTITSLEIDTTEPLPFTPYTDTVVALCVRALTEGQPERRYIPLHPETLLSAEVLPDTTHQPKYLRKLRWQVNAIEEIVASEYSDDARTKQSLLDELNATFDEYIEAASLRIECVAYARFVGARHQGVFVDAKGQTVIGELPSFVWEEHRPVLELFDDQQPDVRFRIDIDDIQSIMPLPEQDEPAGADLLVRFDDTWHQTAWHLAKDLSYASPGEFGAIYADSIDALDQLLPSEELLDAVSVTGIAWAEGGRFEALRQEFIDTNTAIVEGPDFVTISGDIRAVLRLTILDQPSADARTVYIQPHPDHLLRLKTLYEPRDSP